MNYKLIENDDFNGGRLSDLLRTDKVKYFIKQEYFPDLTDLEFFKEFEKNCIKSLKKHKIYYQTGIRENKKCYLTEHLFFFIKMTTDAKFFADALFSIPAEHYQPVIMDAIQNMHPKHYVQGEKLHLDYLTELIKDICTPIPQYRVLTYNIDLFIPVLNVAIEYDEKQHSGLKHAIADKNRESEIKNILGCEFMRIDETGNVVEQIELIADELRKMYNKRLS